MLDRNGFQRKNFADLKLEMETKAKELFGEDTNLSIKSPIGILIWLFAWFLAKVWELAEKVYYSGYTTKAEGIQLDYLTNRYNTSRNPEQAARVTLTFTGTPSFTITAGTRFETESGIEFAITENITLDSNGNGEGDAVSLTPGVIGNVDPNTIIVQSEPLADVLTVTNLDQAIGGRDEETDPELVARLLNSNAALGSGTPDSIVAAVLNVPGVRAANISVNNSMDIVNGQPPKSFQVFALGGESITIGDTIFSKMTGGIEAFGTTAVAVTDISGNSHTVKYTPATAVNIASNVNVVTDSTFPVDGVSQIQDAIVKVVGGTASDGTIYIGLNMGDDVIWSKMFAAVSIIPGVVDATVTVGKVTEAQGTSNILINSNEVAQIDVNDISVVVS
jgi:uncharacterized phage protein gp47/JayE